MRARLLIVVVAVALAFGVGWYVSAQVTRQLPDFVDGQVLTAAELNAVVDQVDSNTAAIAANGLSCTVISESAVFPPDFIGDTEEVVANCPSGRIATGGGCRCDNAPTAICNDGLDDKPLDDLTGWVCRGRVRADGALTTFAVCCVGTAD